LSFDTARVLPPHCSQFSYGSQDNEEGTLVSWADEIEISLRRKFSFEWMQRVCDKKIHDENSGESIVSEVFKGYIQDTQVREIHVGNNNKLRTYAMFCELSCAGVLEMAAYLRWVQNVKERLLLTRFRVGVLALRIETGRWESSGAEGPRGIPVEFRVCQCCDSGKVEDEIHFLLECNVYVLERESLLNVIKFELFADTDASISCRKSKIEGLQVINDKLVVSDVLEGFVSIMRSSNAKVCRATARFIGQAFQRRTILLKKMHNEGVSCSVNLSGTQK